jgi:citrate lyase beta subunit
MPSPWSFCRSIICTPGLNPERFENGFKNGADSVLLDLEDSIPQEHKADARRDVTRFLAQRKDQRLWGVRLNRLSSADGIYDVMALLESGARPDLVMFTKVESPYELEMVHNLFTERGLSIDCSAVVETARGMANVAEIARSPRVKMLIFGAADFALDMAIEFSWRTLEQPRFQLVMASAVADVVAADSPYFKIDDLPGLAQECQASRGMGFSCKIALHPNQIPAINAAFSPSAKSVEEARRIIEANRISNDGITTVDGHMIGPPFVKMAERVLQTHEKQATMLTAT